MRKGKLFTGKAWKRMVRILSCIVVFCTTYALILPAITQEAQAYCGNLEHEHTKECYKEILSCTREEHVHSEECFDTDGNLTCTLEEHTHSGDCYRELLECTEEEHTHSLECFSDDDADLETEEDWKKTLPDEKALKDKTDAEKVLMIAESQKGCKESEKNYIVENEIEKKGITRYGQWDEDPYEDWAGAYARFVLHYAGIETADAKKHVSDWLEQLHDKDELRAADEAEAGDVLFVYDEKDQLKAGIVSEVKDETVKAWMGDWDNQVKEKTFSKTDEKVHSVWKAIQKEEPADTKQPEGPVEPEVPAEEEQNPEEAPKANEEKPAEQPKDEEPVVSYDFTQEVEAEDGARIKVSWNAGTFETEDVVFQAKKVELTEEEQKKVQEQLDKDKNYTFRNYDLTFYVQDENMELQKVEPMQPVHVEIEFADENTADEKLPVFHFKDDGELETLEKTQERLEASKDNSTRFKANSFTVYSVPMPLAEGTESRANYKEVSNRAGLWQAFKDGVPARLTANMELFTNDELCLDNSELGGKKLFTVDLNGYSITSKNRVFYIPGGVTLRLENSKDVTNTTADRANDWNYGFDDSTNPSYIMYYKFKDDSGTAVNYTNGIRYEARGIGLIISSGKQAIECNGGTLITDGIGFSSVTGPGGDPCETAIYAHNNSNIQLNNSYITRSKKGIYQDSGNLLLDKTVVSWNVNESKDNRGGGIEIAGTTKCTIRNNSLISANKAWAGGGIEVGTLKSNKTKEDAATLVFGNSEICGNESIVNEGGGVALTYNSGAIGLFYSGEIYENNVSDQQHQWGGGGIFGSEGTYTMFPEGASIYENVSEGLGGGFTGCSTGKLIINENMWITDNTANAKDGHFTVGSSKPTDHDYNGKYSDIKNHTGAAGDDIFGADLTVISGQFSNGEEAKWSGNIDGNKVSDLNNGYITANQFLTVQSQNKQNDNLKTQKLKIYKNHSNTHGGGVLINGFFSSNEDEEQYLPDKVLINTNKSLVKQNNPSESVAMTDGQFQFEIVDQYGNQVGYALSDSNGNVLFPDGLAVEKKGTYQFSLKEIIGDQSNISYDKSEYVITIQSSQESWKDYWKPKINPETLLVEPNQFVHVIVYKTTITSVTVEKRNDPSWQSNSNCSVNLQPSEGNQKSLSIGNNSSAAFTNLKRTQIKIGIKKEWEGGNSGHQTDSVTVKVGRYIITKQNGESIKTEDKDFNLEFVLNNDNGWSALTQNVLPTENNAGNAFEYFVKETNSTNPLFSPGTIKTTISANTSGPIDPTPSEPQYMDIWIPFTGTLEPQKNTGQEVAFITTEGNVMNAKQDGSYSVESAQLSPSSFDTTQGQFIGYTADDIDRTCIFTTGEYSQKGVFKANTPITEDVFLGYYGGKMQLRSGKDINQDSHHMYIENGNLMVNPGSGFVKLKYSNGDFTVNGSTSVRVYKKSRVQISTGGQQTNQPGVDVTQTFTITNSKNPVYGFNILKKNDLDNTPLANAEFTITNSKGEVLKFTESIEKSEEQGNPDIKIYKYDPQGSVTNLVSDTDGCISIRGLLKGEYTVEETRFPTGFYKPENQDAKWTVKLDSETSQILKVYTVFNTPYMYELPETGSAGTKIYTATGTILLLTGTSLYRYKRRRRRKGGEAH